MTLHICTISLHTYLVRVFSATTLDDRYLVVQLAIGLFIFSFTLQPATCNRVIPLLFWIPTTFSLPPYPMVLPLSFVNNFDINDNYIVNIDHFSARISTVYSRQDLSLNGFFIPGSFLRSCLRVFSMFCSISTRNRSFRTCISTHSGYMTWEFFNLTHHFH